MCSDVEVDGPSEPAPGNPPPTPAQDPSRWDGRQLPYRPSPVLGVPPSLPLDRAMAPSVDPITYQVIRWKLWNLNLEHSDTIKKVSGTPVIVNMDDFNTSILTEDGDNLVCGPTIQYFTGMADLAVKWTLEHRAENPGIESGDVFLQNDPYIATAHQMDAATYAPVFHDGRLFCWVFSMCHQGDLGGITPGGFCVTARDMFDESQPVPPIKLVRRGVLQDDVADMFTRKSRTPEQVALQLRSQIAGLRTAGDRMRSLIDRYGAPTVKAVMRQMIRDCSDAVGRRLRLIPDGRWTHSVHIGSAAEGDRRARRLCVTLRKQGDRILITNEGTDPQFRAINCTFAPWRSTLISAFSTLLAYDQMYCPAGVVDHLAFDPTPGTITCASFPGAVTPVTGTTLSVYLASQVVSKMLLCGPPEVRRAANAAGGSSRPGTRVMSGLDRHGQYATGLPGDMIAGGIGAFSDRDGEDNGGSWFMPRNTAGDAEEWESSMPILYLYRREHQDSGGPGRYRGGNGITMAVTGHKTADWQARLVSIDSALNTTPGLAGGYPGHSGNDLYMADTKLSEQLADSTLPASLPELASLGVLDRLSPRGSVRLLPTDVVAFSFCAGGGFGDPVSREPDLVAEDVRRGSISHWSAAAHYGVVMDGDRIDPDGTAECRRRLRQKRLSESRPPSQPFLGAPPGAPSVAQPAGDALGYVAGPVASVWTCLRCLRPLAPLTDNFKLGCSVVERNPHEVDPEKYPDPSDFCDVPMVLRSYHCPGCGEQLDIEMAPAGDPPSWDLEINPSRPGSER